MADLGLIWWKLLLKQKPWSRYRSEDSCPDSQGVFHWLLSTRKVMLKGHRLSPEGYSFSLSSSRLLKYGIDTSLYTFISQVDIMSVWWRTFTTIKPAAWIYVQTHSRSHTCPGWDSLAKRRVFIPWFLFPAHDRNNFSGTDKNLSYTLVITTMLKPVTYVWKVTFPQVWYLLINNHILYLHIHVYIWIHARLALWLVCL